MISKSNGFDLNLKWSFPDGRKYAFAFIALLFCLLIIYGNSFNGAWVFDDEPGIVLNKHGHLNVFGYHAVNLIILYFSGIFLFLFIYRTLKLPRLKSDYGSSSYAIALLAAFFWAVNPVQVTAVTYIVQRM